MNDAQIKHMGEQFLRWQLPENFNPDGGISFEPIGNKGNSTYEFKRRPSGTNLLDYTQAEAMVRHMLDGLPAKAETTMTSNLDPAYRSPKEDAAYYGSIWSLSTNQMAMLEKSFAEHERTLSHAGEGVSETREQLRRVWAVVEIYRRRHDKMIPADCEVCAFIRDMDNALARPRANTGEG